MRQLGRIAAAAAVALAVALLALAGAADAHVERRSGPFRVSLGWVDEPALSGARNAVEGGVADARGSPVAGPAGALDVGGSYAGVATTLPLVPAEGGGLEAVIVPTRPGTYAFHVTGTLRGKAIDARATCGTRTFECVTAESDVQFPAKDASPGEVAQRLERTPPRAEAAADDADSTKTLATIALIVAFVSLAAMAVLGVSLVRARKNRAR